MLYQKYFKSIFDFTMATLILFLTSPIFLSLTILLVFINNGSPFFLQTRAGFNGNLFRIIKFKSMNDRRSKDGSLLPDSERITCVGSFIRKYSIDELPQLINVIKGDLSLIGPRPLLPQYLPHFNKRQARRHKVKPGMTGWAQVQGRQSVSFEERFEMDIWYVDNMSFTLDIRILTMTLIRVIKSDGVLYDEKYWR